MEEDAPSSTTPEPGLAPEPALGRRTRPSRTSQRNRRYALSFSTSFVPGDAVTAQGGPEGALARLLAATAATPPPLPPLSGIPPVSAAALDEVIERVDPNEIDEACAICLDEIKGSSGHATYALCRRPCCCHALFLSRLRLPRPPAAATIQ